MPTATSVKKKIELLRSAKLEKLPWLVHGFSTRTGGFSHAYGGKALNLGFTPHDSRRAVDRNRETFLTALGAVSSDKHWPLISLRQVHSDLIFHVHHPQVEGTHFDPALDDHAAGQNLTGDGLVTDAPGFVIAVQTADCLPIILVDQKKRAIGVFHAGWRGTVKRIVEKGVGEMRKYFGCDPRNILATIGPGVQSCCYDVGPEVQTKFESQFAYAASLFRETKESDPVREKYPMLFLTARAPGHSELPTKVFLDLNEANRRQLLDAGVAAKNIDISSPCTACNTDLLFSYRAEKGVTGRMMAAAGIRHR